MPHTFSPDVFALVGRKLPRRWSWPHVHLVPDPSINLTAFAENPPQIYSIYGPETKDRMLDVYRTAQSIQGFAHYVASHPSHSTQGFAPRPVKTCGGGALCGTGIGGALAVAN